MKKAKAKRRQSYGRSLSLYQRFLGLRLIRGLMDLSRPMQRGLLVLSLIFSLGVSMSFTQEWRSWPTLMRAEINQILAEHGFRVTTIVIEGRHIVAYEAIETLLKPYEGQPLFAVDLNTVRHALVAHIPWIEEARVERRLPNSLRIHLTEITPLARWKNKDTHYIVTASKIIPTDDADFFKNIPVLAGANAPLHAPDLLRLVAAEPLIQERLKKAERISDRRWNLHLSDGLLIKLPAEDTAFALARLGKQARDHKLLDKAVQVIDMRFDDRIVVQHQKINNETQESVIKN